MVGCTLRLDGGPVQDQAGVHSTYDALLASDDFKKSFQRATADDESVKNRMKLSIDAFSALK
jgi:hypothetical protein